MANYGFYGPNYANPFQGVYQPVNYPQMVPPQQIPPSNQPMQNQNSIIWVNSEMEVMSYPVAPNAAVTLWNAKEPVVYLKKSDSTGKPSVTIYDLVERTESPSAGQAPDYATKDDVAALAGAVKNILGDIETMKGDLYGLSGKRKTAKKEVSEDDE